MFYLVQYTDLSSGCDNKELTISQEKIIMLYLIPWSGPWHSGSNMGPAILPALEYIRREELIPGYEIELLWADTECRKLTGMRKTVDLWLKHGADVIIGDACSTVCITVSLMASVWNIPMVSWGCTAAILSDKSVHDTFSRLDGPNTGYLMLYINLLEAFSWKTVGIISDMAEVDVYVANMLFIELQRRNLTAYYYKTQSTVNHGHLNIKAMAQLHNIIKSMKKRVRVIICIVYDTDFDNIIQLSKDEGMLAGFVFIIYEYQSPQNSAILNGMLFIKVAVSKQIEQWDKFTDQVIEGFGNPMFNNMPSLYNQDTQHQHDLSTYGGDYLLLLAFVQIKK